MKGLFAGIFSLVNFFHELFRKGELFRCPEEFFTKERLVLEELPHQWRTVIHALAQYHDEPAFSVGRPSGAHPVAIEGNELPDRILPKTAYQTAAVGKGAAEKSFQREFKK